MVEVARRCLLSPPLRPRRRTLAVLALLFFGVASEVSGQSFTEIELPTPGSVPRGIARGPDGEIWFTESAANRIGRVSIDAPVEEFPIPTVASQPSGITAGPDGNLWFAEEAGNRIGRITIAGRITEFALPSPSRQPASIAAGPDGNIWFTEIAGRAIGRIAPDGSILEFPLPSESVPSAICAGPDGTMWFTEAEGPGIGRITPGGAVTEFPVTGRPNGIVAGPDGAVWFTCTDPDGIGRITTAGLVTSFGGLTASSVPAGITTGFDGNLWFAESSSLGNRIGRITPAGKVTEFLVPTPACGPLGVAGWPDPDVWFTEEKGNRIGRLTSASALAGSFYTVAPCRLVDTRSADPSMGGPSISPGADRTFAVTGRCWVPSSARSLFVNVTVTEATSAGELVLFPVGAPAPPIASIAYSARQTRANNLIVPVGVLGQLAARCSQSGGSVHVIIDTSGYFQ